MTPPLPRSAVGRHLAARITGRADVECLRRLIAGTGGDEDVSEALAFCDSESLAVAKEDWGPQPWTDRTPRLLEAGDLVRLRAELTLAYRLG